METKNLSISPSWTNFIWLGEAFSISINYRQFVWGYGIEKKDLLTLRASSFHIWNDSKIETKGNHSMETFCFHKIHSLTCICRKQFSQGNKSALLFEKIVSLELKRRTERKRWRERERGREPKIRWTTKSQVEWEIKKMHCILTSAKGIRTTIACSGVDSRKM